MMIRRATQVPDFLFPPLAAVLVGLILVTTPHGAWSGETPHLELYGKINGIGRVKHLQWNPEGTKLGVASTDPIIRIWTIPDRRLAAELSGHGSVVYDLDWGKEKNLLASVACEQHDPFKMHCTTGGVILWDMNTTKNVHQMVFASHPHTAATRMALKEGKASAVDPHSRPGPEPQAVGWSHDGRWLAVGDRIGTLRVWSTGNWTVLFESQAHWAITDLDWSPDGRLATGARDNTIRVWDISQRRVTHNLAHHSLDIYSVTWHPQHTWLASGGGDRTVVIWDVARDTIIQRLTGFDASVRSLAWHPSGHFLATASYAVSNHAGEISVYDTRTWKRVAQHRDTEGKIIDTIAWSPDGSFLASGGGHHKLTLWRFVR